MFSDRNARRDLEAIVHPRVRTRAAELTASAPPDSVVVQVIPLLVETGQADDFDQVVVVDVEPSVQLARLSERDGFSEAEAAARVAAQADRGLRLQAADVVIDNSGTPDDLAAAVDRLWEEWKLFAGGRR